MSAQTSPSSASNPAWTAHAVDFWHVVKQASADWIEDHATRLAASLAFYTMLSLAPLLVLAIRAVGIIFSEEEAKAQTSAYLRDLMETRVRKQLGG